LEVALESLDAVHLAGDLQVAPLVGVLPGAFLHFLVVGDVVVDGGHVLPEGVGVLHHGLHPERPGLGSALRGLGHAVHHAPLRRQVVPGVGVEPEGLNVGVHDVGHGLALLTSYCEHFGASCQRPWVLPCPCASG